METDTKSTPGTDILRLKSGLIRNGHRSLRAWAAKRKINYNTAWAALHGRRSGRVATRVLVMLKKDTGHE
jgi:hypothetical protein